MEKTWNQVTAEWLAGLIEAYGPGISNVQLHGNEIVYLDDEPNPPVKVRLSIICENQ